MNHPDQPAEPVRDNTVLSIGELLPDVVDLEGRTISYDQAAEQERAAAVNETTLANELAQLREEFHALKARQNAGDESDSLSEEIDRVRHQLWKVGSQVVSQSQQNRDSNPE